MSKTLLTAATLALHVTVALAGSPSIDEHLSSGGSRFVLATVPEADELVIRVAWPTDWAVKRDINHAVPILAMISLFAGGAEGFDPGAFDVRMEDLGAEARLTIGPQFAFGTMVMPRRDAGEVLSAINAHLRAPRFHETWFRRRQDSLRNFVAEKRREPKRLAFDTIYWAAFGDHPIRKSAIVRDLDAERQVNRSDLASWVAATYTSVPVELVVSGDIDFRTAGRLVDLLLRDLPGDALPPAALPVGVPRAGKVLVHAPLTTDSYMAVIGAVAESTEWPRQHDGFIEWTLSHSGGGILNEAVRGSARAAYFINAEVGEFHYGSPFLLMHGSVDTSKASASVEELLQVYESYLKSPLIDGLEQFRSGTQDTFERTKDDPGELSIATIKAALRGHDVSTVLERLASAERLSPDVIRERVRKGYPKPGDLLVVVVSPDADALPGACVIEVPMEVLECELN